MAPFICFELFFFLTCLLELTILLLWKLWIGFHGIAGSLCACLFSSLAFHAIRDYYFPQKRNICFWKQLEIAYNNIVGSFCVFVFLRPDCSDSLDSSKNSESSLFDFLSTNFFQSGLGYLDLSHPKYLASVFACSFPLFGRALFTNLGSGEYLVRWGSNWLHISLSLLQFFTENLKLNCVADQSMPTKLFSHTS